MGGVEGGDTGEEGLPVGAAPILGLDLGADADGEEGVAGGGGEDLGGAGFFLGGEVKVPRCGVVEAGVAQLVQVAGKAGGFGFEEGFAVDVRLAAWVLHVFGDGDADLTEDAAEAEEGGVAFGGGDSAGGADVDEGLGPKADDLPPEAEELARAAGADGVTHVGVDEAGVFEDGGGGWGFGGHGEVGEHAALCVGEGAGDEVQGGQGDKGVAEGAETVDEDPFGGGWHRGSSLLGSEAEGNCAKMLVYSLLGMSERLIPESGELVGMLDQATLHWHEASADVVPDGMQRFGIDDAAFRTMILALHRANFDLWHEEDEARNPDATDARIADVKRSIDRLNQQRNDVVEAMDVALSARVQQVDTSPLHSETPAMIVDRLSIMSLKVYHTREETMREEAAEAHRSKNRARLAVLVEQRSDVAGCLDDLIAQIADGERRFKVYRQMKMYNDPELNPVLYRRSGG